MKASMGAKQFLCVLTTTESRVKIWCQYNAFKPAGGLGCCPFRGGGSVVVYSLFMNLTLFVGVLCWSLFWYSLLCVLSSFAIILSRKRELVALLLLSS